jgi:competence protein ComEA
MDQSPLFAFLPQTIRDHLLPLGLAIVGILLIGIGLLPLSLPKTNQDSSVAFESGAESAASVAGEMTSSVMIEVDIAGAVVSPGVYSLPENARVRDGVDAAGGFSQNANKAWIAKNLNLAAKLSDAQKLYIPFEGEETSMSGVDVNGGNGAGNGQMNINSAGSSELDTLPGVGPATVAKIISGRPYGSVDDLVSKKIVSQNAFEKIKTLISIN